MTKQFQAIILVSKSMSLKFFIFYFLFFISINWLLGGVFSHSPEFNASIPREFGQNC
jgi:hypothetical protein